MRSSLVGVAVLLVALVAGCAPTHTSLADALAGAPGDRLDVEPLRVATEPQVRFRVGARDGLTFTVCDRDQNCILVEVATSAVEYAVDDFVRLRGALAREDDGTWYVPITTSIVQKVQPPADWPG